MGAHLCGLCRPCRLLSRIHCRTLWAGSVVTLGSCGGPPQPSAVASSVAERHERLERELERLREEERKEVRLYISGGTGSSGLAGRY